MPTPLTAPRLREPWLDWMRGLAVLLMIQVHSLDAWLAPYFRQGDVHRWLVFLGGLAAPSFLFMAGLSQRLADEAAERAGKSPRERRLQALRRAGEILVIAYLFRLGEYFLGFAWRVPGGWHMIFKVDILNVIGVSLVMLVPVSVGVSRIRALVGSLLLGLAIVLAAPFVTKGGVPQQHFLDYFFAMPPRANFAVFNWAAFACAGAAFAVAVRERVHPLVIIAIGLFLDWAGHQAALRIGVARVSPRWFCERLGWVVTGAGVLMLLPTVVDRVLGWLRALGRHSLLVYMLSVELTYGLITRPMHRASTPLAVGMGMLVITLVCWQLSLLLDRRQARRKAAAAAARASAS
jgi:uncharacterized membrane protein